MCARVDGDTNLLRDAALLSLQLLLLLLLRLFIGIGDALSRVGTLQAARFGLSRDPAFACGFGGEHAGGSLKCVDGTGFA